MNQKIYPLLYQLRLKEVHQFANHEELKTQADRIIHEIRQHIGEDVEIHLSIEPEKHRRRFAYSITLNIDLGPKQIHVHKTGRVLHTTLNRVKRMALKTYHRQNKKLLASKRRPRFFQPRLELNLDAG